MYCILIAGAPASGKTTFANYLSEKIRVPVLAKDDIKEKLFDSIGFRSYDEKRRLDLCATEIMYLLAASQFKLGLPVILDNNFENSSVPSLRSLLDRYEVPVLTVRFEGDMTVIYERFLERDMSPDRHRGHVLKLRYPEETPEPYIPIGTESFAERYEDRGMTSFSMGRLITVDCTDLSAVDYDIVTAEILKALQEILP